MTNQAALLFQLSCLNPITPIHFPDEVGSLSISPAIQINSSTELGGIDLTKAKAWCVYNGLTGVIRNSFNISGVVKISTGLYIFYFEKPFKNRDYVVMVSGREQIQAILNNGSQGDNPKPGSVQTFLADNAGGVQDRDYFAIACFGELVEEE
jgi:hypothetical protein